LFSSHRLRSVFAPVKPVSVVITERQLEWLDHRRAQGCISRSAVLRILLDRLIQQEQAQVAVTKQTDGL
jgi:metal-responsive CopG/Arc/MetJ family transcriptional regulator